MISIAIIDDMQEDINLIHNELNKLFTLYDYEISSFNGEDIDNILEKHFDLYLMDIEMPNINGINLAEKINKYHDNSTIMFVSHNEDFIVDIFSVKVASFIRKSNLERDLKKSINKFLENYLKSQKTYLTKNNESIKFSDIMYFESEKNYVNIISEDKVFKERVTIKEILSLTDELDFVYVNKGLVVNLDWVNYIEKDIITLKNNLSLQISRRNISDVNKKYIDYKRRSL